MGTEPSAAKPRKTIARRLIFFLLGGAVNYVLIAFPFKYLQQAHPEMPKWQISAASMGVSTVFFFFWNYFINFRTDMRKRDALGRYLTAVAAMYGLATGLLTLFKEFNANLSLHLGTYRVDLDVVATQACMGWLKFIIYHKWAFPAPKETVPASPGEGS